MLHDPAERLVLVVAAALACAVVPLAAICAYGAVRALITRPGRYDPDACVCHERKPECDCREQ